MLLSTGMIARGRLGTPDVLAGIAKAAEAIGLHGIWFGDRTVYAVDYESGGPDHKDKLPWNIASPQNEGIVNLTWVLAATTRLRAGVSVMILPLRNPVVLARQVATIDHLSKGRLNFGVGLGGIPEEFNAIGVPWERRGARMDEYLRAMRTLWTEEKPSFAGEFTSFPEVYCNPKPVQKGGPPIYIGGHSEAAYRRVARYADGWAASSTEPDEVKTVMANIRAQAEALGRDPASIKVLCTTWKPDRDEMRRRLAAYQEVGVDEVAVPVQGKSLAEAEDYLATIPDLLS